MKTVTSASSGTFLQSRVTEVATLPSAPVDHKGLGTPLSASLDSPDMTSPAEPTGPRVAKVDHQADLLDALGEANLGRGVPVVVLIGGAAGVDQADSDAWLPLVRDGVVRPAADLGA